MFNTYFLNDYLNYKWRKAVSTHCQHLLLSFPWPRAGLLAVLPLTFRVWNHFLCAICRTESEFSIDSQKGLFQSYEHWDPASTDLTWKTKKGHVWPTYPWLPISTCCKNPWESFQVFYVHKRHLGLQLFAMGQGRISILLSRVQSSAPVLQNP